MLSVHDDKVEIDVVTSLIGSIYEDISKDLAKEFEKARINFKEEVHNAPLKIKVTHGADIYEVMRRIMAHEVNVISEFKEEGVE